MLLMHRKLGQPMKALPSVLHLLRLEPGAQGRGRPGTILIQSVAMDLSERLGMKHQCES